MQTRSGAEIVVDGDVVYKLHRPGTDLRTLTTRLRIAAESGSLLTPLDATPEMVGTRWRTRWPRVEIVVPQPGCLPWADAGRLLAQLHGEAMLMRMPHGWPHRLRRMLRYTSDATVRRAAAELPDEVWRAGSTGRPITLVPWRLASGPTRPPRRALGTGRRRRPRRRRPGMGSRPPCRFLGGGTDPRQ